MRALLLSLPIILTLFVSGCTMPGMPCIPGLTCSQTVEETHDVIVVESIQALPNNIAPGGTINIVAIVSNVADIDAEIRRIDNIDVELYDYCEGLFEKLPDAKQTISLLRGEKEQVEWVLKALPREQVPVKTECTLKIRAKYPYETKSITTLHLIDFTEMQRRISEGTHKEIGSYTSVGYGPIKPYVYVEGTQPIPIEGNVMNTVLSFQVKNRGNGFLSTSSGQTEPLISNIKVTVTGDSSGNLQSKLDECFNNNKDIKDGLKLINGETTKIPCPIDSLDVGNVPVESTKTIQAEVTGYSYEFRKEIKVTVEPKF